MYRSLFGAYAYSIFIWFCHFIPSSASYCKWIRTRYHSDTIWRHSRLLFFCLVLFCVGMRRWEVSLRCRLLRASTRLCWQTSVWVYSCSFIRCIAYVVEEVVTVAILQPPAFLILHLFKILWQIYPVCRLELLAVLVSAADVLFEYAGIVSR